jgi:putative phosphoesterase
MNAVNSVRLEARRIGVVSDTHNRLPNVARIVEIFNRAGVDRVVHTGDITQAKTLEVLARLEAPVVGVYGNNDAGERDALAAAAHRLKLDFVDGPLFLEWSSRRIVVVHDPLDLQRATMNDCDVALHGHDHQFRRETRDGVLVFNPGECAGHMPGRNAVGVLDLVSLESEILRF